MISDPWIDRTWQRSPRTGKGYVTTYARRSGVTKRRIALIRAGKCINGPLLGNVGFRGVEHGPVIAGTNKCQRCIDVARGVAMRLTRDRVLRALARFDVATTGDIARSVGGRQATVRDHLTGLVDSGLASRLGGNHIRYSITEAGRKAIARAVRLPTRDERNKQGESSNGTTDRR